MNRPRFLASAVGLAATAAMRGAATADTLVAETTLDTGSGRLHGTLEIPRVAGRVAVVLIISGSGPTNRNGNVPMCHGSKLQGCGNNDSLKLLAEGLSDRGVSSLRYDKRGVGASSDAATGELRFETFVADAAAWIAKLRADRRFTRVVVAGHSEGSLIGMLAARLQSIDALASLEGAGRPAATVLRAQFRNSKYRDEAYAVIASLEAGKTIDSRGYVYQSFLPSVQPYMISWFRFDPAAELQRLRVPTTIVQGTADVQTRQAEGEALAAAAPSARYELISGMNHVLKFAPDTSSQAAIIAGYVDPLPVMPAVINAVATLAG